MNGAAPINYSAFTVRATLKGIRRKLGDTPHRARPAFPSMLHAMFAHLINSLGHIAWRAAMLCCFRGLLRKCQITASDSMLQCKDFKFFQWGMLITKKHAKKTIKFKERILESSITYCPDRELCAVF